MLANTRFEDILFDRETIIGFFESKDPNETFDYTQPDRCAFTQFLAYNNVDYREFYRTCPGACFPPGIWDDIVCYGEGAVHTFGETLARAKELLK